MPEVNIKDLDAALNDIYNLAGQTGQEPTTRAKPVGSARRIRRWLLKITGVVLILLLPFFVLIRSSVFYYLHAGMPTWIAVLLGMGSTTLLLMGYGLWFTRKWKERLRFKWVVRSLLVLVCVYSGYTLLYISASNVKTEDVRSTYTELHPLLRLGVSTLTLVDQDLIVTDAARRSEDYGRMGLPVFENSLHFEQPNGYVHAVDLRTIGRGEWKNLLMTGYFRIMGFNTLRHVGTADHLHVSLPVP